MSPRERSTLAGRRAVVVNWRDPWHRLAGGSERYAWEFALALRAAGAEVEFLTARERGQRRTQTHEGIAIRRGGGPFTFYAHAAAMLLRRRRRRLDIVIDPECGIPTFSPIFVRRTTAVVLVLHHVHQEQFRTYFPAPLAWVGRTLERVAMPRVYRGRATVAVSESTRREMHRQLGWTGPVGILGNGAATVQADCPAEGKDVARMVVLGRLVPHKRVDLVLRALHALREERPALRLDVCGQGPDRGRLEELTARLGLTDRVTFHGFLAEADKGALLRRAGLHVCASDVEGWGQAVIDAAGYGVPTVARDVPGLRDSVRDGTSGWLVPDAGDTELVLERLTEQVRAALRELEEPENLALAVKACREWAATFSWTQMHEQAQALVADELGRVRAGHRNQER